MNRSLNILGLIPARMASSRFPGKPLAIICGMPMIGHVFFRSKMSRLLTDVYMTTCDEEIQQYCKKINAPCIMTKSTHERATERIAEAVQKIEQKTCTKVDIAVLIQGDEPMLSPELVDVSLKALLQDPSKQVSCLMSPIMNAKEAEDPNLVKVVVNLRSEAIYFSREVIPSLKKENHGLRFYRQLPIISFRRNYLLKFIQLEPTPLEKAESVDLMRVLEHGEIVQMVSVEDQSISVDTPQDLARVNQAMKEDSLIAVYAAGK